MSGQILADLQTKMRALPQYLCPSVTEAWLRRYQVNFPSRHLIELFSPNPGTAWTHTSNDGYVGFRRIRSPCHKGVRAREYANTEL
jgi:hypothetical protein